MTDSAEASVTMQQAKRILLIGLGRWGANHLRVLQSMPIDLFVAERDPERLNSSGVSQSHRAADASSLFPIIDAAVVVTPAQTHFEICRELLEGGKDVFVEKSPRGVHAVMRNFLGRAGEMDDESLIVLEYDCGDSAPILATIEAGYHLPGKVRELTIVGKDSSSVCDYNVAQYKIKTFEN